MGWAVSLMMVCGGLIALAIIACIPRPKWLKRLNQLERGRADQAE